MPNIVIVNASLNPKSKSLALGLFAKDYLSPIDGVDVSVINLKDISFALCDGAQAYGHPELANYKEQLEKADGMFISAPVYNYDLNAALKNFIELTGQSWAKKVLAFACFAGGERSYMAPLSLMNSMMVDFRCLVLPNYVYASDKSYDQQDIDKRLIAILDDLVSLSSWQQQNEF